MTTFDELKAQHEEIYTIGKKYGVKDICVFGSIVRGDDTSESDIDLLIKMESSRDLVDLSGFMLDAEELFGRKVDVIMDDSIYYMLKGIILSEARPL